MGSRSPVEMAEIPPNDQTTRNDDTGIANEQNGRNTAGDGKDIDAETPTNVSNNGGEKGDEKSEVESGEAAGTGKKPNLFKRAWTALDLNPGIVMMMFKYVLGGSICVENVGEDLC